MLQVFKIWTQVFAKLTVHLFESLWSHQCLFSEIRYKQKYAACRIFKMMIVKTAVSSLMLEIDLKLCKLGVYGCISLKAT